MIKAAWDNLGKLIAGYVAAHLSYFIARRLLARVLKWWRGSK